MSKLKRLDGAVAQFSKRARERIPPAVINRIKEINWLDVELHEVATEMATEMIKRERAKGMQVMSHSQCITPCERAFLCTGNRNACLYAYTLETPLLDPYRVLLLTEQNRCVVCDQWGLDG